MPRPPSIPAPGVDGGPRPTKEPRRTEELWTWAGSGVGRSAENPWKHGRRVVLPPAAGDAYDLGGGPARTRERKGGERERRSRRALTGEPDLREVKWSFSVTLNSLWMELWTKWHGEDKSKF